MLGAAVADDVMGLVVLTVVVRLVTEGSVSFLERRRHRSRRGRLPRGRRLRRPARRATAVRRSSSAFSRSTGRWSRSRSRSRSRSPQLADAAKLAPIVGAFVAGLALCSQPTVRAHPPRAGARRSSLHPGVLPADRHRRATSMPSPSVSVLRDAAILLVVAVVGKLVSPIGAIGSPGDKLLIGLGMLPRGEVGLIFATIGLQNGRARRRSLRRAVARRARDHAGHAAAAEDPLRPAST